MNGKELHSLFLLAFPLLLFLVGCASAQPESKGVSDKEYALFASELGINQALAPKDQVFYKVEQGPSSSTEHYYLKSNEDDILIIVSRCGSEEQANYTRDLSFDAYRSKYKEILEVEAPYALKQRGVRILEDKNIKKGFLVSLYKGESCQYEITLDKKFFSNRDAAFEKFVLIYAQSLRTL